MIAIYWGKKWTATTYKVRTKQKNDSSARSAQEVLLKETTGIIKWKGKKNKKNTVGKAPTSNMKIGEIDKINTPSAQIHDHLLSGLCTCNSM